VLALVGLAGLALINQPYYPASWQDEGFALQGAMNLARYGQYAMRSSEGFRVLDQPLIANGPGLVLPISAAFLVLGIDLVTARLVMVVYFVATVALFFAVARRLFGAQAALISTVVMLALPSEGYILFGRLAIGLIPALCYFLIGFWMWLDALERRSAARAVLAGLAFGIAIVTKNQYLLIVPALILVACVDLISLKTIGLRAIGLTLLGIALCMTAWYGIQHLMAGPGQFARNLQAISSSTRVTVAAFRAQRWPGSGWYLVRSGFVPLILPGVVYAAVSGWRNRAQGARWSLLIALIGIWLVWYVIASVGWPRYAFDPFVLGALFAGPTLIAALRYARGQAPRRWPQWVAGLYAVALIIASSVGLTLHVMRILEPPDRSAQQFAAYLLQHVEPGQVIESWEWEIDVLADRTFHHPTNDWVDSFTAVTQFHESNVHPYNPLACQPAYLINGPFSKWTGIYSDTLAGGCCQPIVTIGSYDLYAVRSTPQTSSK
jgi:4-amino-4-deoxy-L-arabinose transferase-like glycosyltransferase